MMAEFHREKGLKKKEEEETHMNLHMLNDKFLHNLIPCQTNWHNVSTTQPMFLISISNKCVIQKKKRIKKDELVECLWLWWMCGDPSLGCIQSKCNYSEALTYSKLSVWLHLTSVPIRLGMISLRMQVSLFCYCLVLSLVQTFRWFLTGWTEVSNCKKCSQFLRTVVES